MIRPAGAENLGIVALLEQSDRNRVEPAAVGSPDEVLLVASLRTVDGAPLVAIVATDTTPKWVLSSHWDLFGEAVGFHGIDIDPTVVETELPRAVVLTQLLDEESSQLMAPLVHTTCTLSRMSGPRWSLGVGTRKQDRSRLSHLGHAVALHPGGRMSQEFSDFFSMLRCISAPEEPTPSGPPVLALEDAPPKSCAPKGSVPVLALGDASPPGRAQGPASSSGVVEQPSFNKRATWGEAKGAQLDEYSSLAEVKEAKRTRLGDDSPAAGPQLAHEWKEPKSWAEWKEATSGSWTSGSWTTSSWSW